MASPASDLDTNIPESKTLFIKWKFLIQIEYHLPLPKGGSDEAPIFLGTKSMTSVFKADFE